MREPAVLAFDASADAFTAVFWRGGKAVELQSAADIRHAGSIFGEIAKLMKKARSRVDDADVIAVGLGPGSFTGIRVGVTAAKTFAYASRKRLMGISSLEILSQNWAGPRGTVCVVQDARRGNVYAAAYNGQSAVWAPRLVSGDDFVAEAPPAFYYMGNALAEPAFAARLEDRVGHGRLDADRKLAHPRAARMVPLVLARWSNGRFDDPLTLRPDYLYDRDCNVTLKAKGGS